MHINILSINNKMIINFLKGLFYPNNLSSIFKDKLYPLLGSRFYDSLVNC